MYLPLSSGEKKYVSRVLKGMFMELVDCTASHFGGSQRLRLLC